MSVKQRYRFAAKLLRCLAAGGFISVASCSMPVKPAPGEPPGAIIDDQSGPEQRIERDLERLRVLDVMELGDLVQSRTDATGSPYTAEPMTVDEQADRLEAFTDIAEVAVADVDAAAISDQFQDEAGEPNLCVRNGDDTYCLTTAMHEDNLLRVNQLEVIAVSDIVRADAPASGACYSSWDTVTEVDCVRAIKLSAIVDQADGNIE